MRKQLFVLCALLLAGMGANAQSYVDYSSMMSQDYLTGWSVASGNFRSGVEYYNDTASNFSGLDMSQTITGLPAGTYTVSFYATVNEANGSEANSSGTEFRAYVQDASTEGNYATGTVGTLSAGGISWGSDGFPLYTFTVTLASGGSLKYGISNTGNGGNWAVVQPVSLILSVDEQAEGDVVHDCLVISGPYDSSADRCTPIEWSSNEVAVGNFHVNTWSTEGNSDGSNMTTPFIEYWMGSGNNLTDAVLSHDQLTGLVAGYYRVSVFARAYNENSTTAVGSGITFNANGGSVDLTTGTVATTSAGSTEVYGTYTLYPQVTEEGTLDINFTVASEQSSDWVAWKDLKVEYIGEEPCYIGEATADASYVTGGQEVTITFETMAQSGDYVLVGEGFTDSTVGDVSYDGDGVFSFTVPDDASGTLTVTIPEGQLYYQDMGVQNEETTLTFTVLDIENQYGVYLMNCHTEEFLSRGFAWGTEADADYYGIPVNIVADASGLYTIQFVDNSAYIGDTYWAYGDCTGDRVMHYTIEPYSEDGVYGYRFRGEEASSEVGTDCYLYLNESGDFLIANNGHAGEINGDPQNYDNIAQTVWQILTKEEHAAQKAAFVQSQKDDIAAKAGADDFDEYIASKVANDVTRLVEDPAFASAVAPGETGSGWLGSYAHAENGNNGSFTPSANGFESWNGCMQLQQTITGLAEGVYKIDLQGLYRQASNAVCYPYKDYDMSTAYIDANGYEINLMSWAEEATLDGTTYAPNSVSEAYSACVTGYANELYTYVGSDGELVITIASPGYAFDEWLYLRGLALTYYGSEIGDDDEYKTGDVVTVGDVEYTVMSGNLLVNGGFNNGMIGWTGGNGYTTAAFPADFNVQSSGGFNGNPYLTASSAGAASEKTPTQAVAIESGKKYLFIGYTSGTTPTSDNVEFSSLYEMSGATTEVSVNDHSVPYVTLAWGADYGETSSTWTQTKEVFTASTAYAGVRLGWSTGSYDGFQLYEVEEPTEIEWTLGAEYGTLILPFAYDLSGTSLTAYTGAINGDVMELTAVDGNAVAAYTPYIIGGATEAQTTYTFSGVPGEEPSSLADASGLTGVLVDTYAPANSYVLQNQTGTPAFYLVESANSILVAAYHCYLSGSAVSGTGVKAITFSFGDDVTTGIEAVDSEAGAGSDVIYDLSGRRVAKAQKGVYIVNGKKVVIK